MFYIKECYFRLLYILYTACILFILFFIKKELLLLLINYKCLKPLSTNVALFETFVYSSPVELLYVYLSIVIYFMLFIFIPYCLWSFFDFYKGAIKISTYKLLKFIFYFNIIITIFIFFNSFLIIYPKIWLFFETLNSVFEKNTIFNFYYQLHFSKYFFFFQNYIKLVFSCYIIFIICGLISFLFKLNFLIKFRKLFILINAIAATILSPPDVFSQLFFFILLTVVTESLLFFFIFLLKYTSNKIKLCR